MHGYYRDRMRLNNKLATFDGGQFLIENKNGLVYRGEIRDWSIPDMSQKRILIFPSWLCEPSFGVDKDFKPVPKWVLVKPTLGFRFLNVEFTFYYFQRKREDREERIKMWTPD